MKIHLHKVEGDKLAPTTELTQHRGEITALLYSPDGVHLASGDGNREVLVWQNGKAKVSGWVYHTTKINSLSWASDNDHLATVGTDGNLIVWSVSKPDVRIQQKNAHPGGVLATVWLNYNDIQLLLCNPNSIAPPEYPHSGINVSTHSIRRGPIPKRRPSPQALDQ